MASNPQLEAAFTTAPSSTTTAHPGNHTAAHRAVPPPIVSGGRPQHVSCSVRDALALAVVKAKRQRREDGVRWKSEAFLLRAQMKKLKQDVLAAATALAPAGVTGPAAEGQADQLQQLARVVQRLDETGQSTALFCNTGSSGTGNGCREQQLEAGAGRLGQQDILALANSMVDASTYQAQQRVAEEARPQLQRRAQTLNSFLQGLGVLQLRTAAAELSELDALSAQSSAAAVVKFVQETLLCAPASEMRSTYMGMAVEALAAALHSDGGRCSTVQQHADTVRLVRAFVRQLLQGSSAGSSGCDAEPSKEAVQKVEACDQLLQLLASFPSLGLFVLEVCAEFVRDVACTGSRAALLDLDDGAPEQLLGQLAGICCGFEAAHQVLAIQQRCTGSLPTWLKLQQGTEQRPVALWVPEVFENAVTVVMDTYDLMGAVKHVFPLFAVCFLESMAALAATVQHAAMLPQAASEATRARCRRLCALLKEKLLPPPAGSSAGR
jgi:hypothetical protein